jgi:hypothetical protein
MLWLRACRGRVQSSASDENDLEYYNHDPCDCSRILDQGGHGIIIITATEDLQEFV